ncbi:polynucleotide adenylyltransferase [Dimargaris verticillata]|uniref:Poly(A) polymerase n=1 Tax=Dimargaris verticillata TaxID=2761393 RepID=A0A9W8B966_9FUNG|nr:polynucleotide adenylyltransferase [Dimargaris verticillata]
MNRPYRQLGVTRPISLEQPTAHELEVTTALLETLKAEGLYESEEESRRREIVLGKLDKMVKDFVYKVSIARNSSEADAREAGGKIFTFGSYRLGVHGAGADIDTLCVVPAHVSREDFFTVMHDMLKQRPEVTELTSVPEAYVPVIKMYFSGIPIDFVFARLARPTVPPGLELFDNRLLQYLDDQCIRSLNGSRVTDEILRLVPNVDTFRTALRCIKLWAKRRAIYSNVMGFFGGVVWAMLVARVCQLYPNACGGAIVFRFFRIMHQWNWPQPVLLKEIEDGPLSIPVWNPRLNAKDRYHRMPVITPAYPSMCATHNVSESTKQLMVTEFKKAFDVVDDIMLDKAKWEDLFQKHDFFTRYRNYIQVIASSDSQDRQLIWAGMIESRLRQLVGKLDDLDMLKVAHPFIKGFERNFECATAEEASEVKRGIIPPTAIPITSVTESVASSDARPTTENTASSDRSSSPVTTADKQSVYTTSFYIGILVTDPKPGGEPSRLDVSWPTQEYINLVKAWPHFEDEHMGVVVRRVRRSMLPTDVYEGQPPPPPPSASKRTKSDNGTDKGPEADADADAQSAPAKKLRSQSSIEPLLPDSIPDGTAISIGELARLKSQRKNASTPSDLDQADGTGTTDTASDNDGDRTKNASSPTATAAVNGNGTTKTIPVVTAGREQTVTTRLPVHGSTASASVGLTKRPEIKLRLTKPLQGE